MLARVFSCAVIGLEGVIIEVEVDTGQGLPSIVVVQLLDTSVQESRERVQSAIKNSGLSLPRNWVTVNLAPAAVRKEDPAYDLPIAVAMRITTGRLLPSSVEKALIVGKLSRDGNVRHVRGEAALIPDLEVIPISSLVKHLLK